MGLQMSHDPWNPPHTSTLPFSVVLSTIYGDMIVHRNDSHQTVPLLKLARAVIHNEVRLLARLLSYCPDDRHVVDVGASYGSFALALSKVVGARGKVHAFEPQRIIFNMLAGSIALNSFMNVYCYNMAVGNREGRVEIPQFDYKGPQMSYGSVEFGPEQRQKLDQARKHDAETQEYVPLTTLDRFEFQRLDLLKIDAEGMEMEILDGAEQTIRRCRPMMFVEFIKVDREALRNRLAGFDYAVADLPGNFLAIPTELEGKLPSVSTLVHGLF
jgi:FkbM family methyltransferase